MTWWHSNTIFNTYTGHESTESVHVATSLEKPKMNLPKQIQTFKEALALSRALGGGRMCHRLGNGYVVDIQPKVRGAVFFHI